MSLRRGATPYGVLKVEFPNTFDDKNHYSKEDMAFFEKCAAVLLGEIEEYKNFIESEYIDVEPEKFTRFMVQIERFQLIRFRG